ncbi:unnamed protein product [Lota lota]
MRTARGQRSEDIRPWLWAGIRTTGSAVHTSLRVVANKRGPPPAPRFADRSPPDQQREEVPLQRWHHTERPGGVEHLRLLPTVPRSSCAKTEQRRPEERMDGVGEGEIKYKNQMRTAQGGLVLSDPIQT